MLEMFLKILMITGIVLLVLLAVFLFLLLLVLFLPVTYKIFGKKNTEEMQAWVKVNWLFGVLRVRYSYPHPGKLTVKILWFTLFDSSGKPVKAADNENAEEKSDLKRQNETVSKLEPAENGEAGEREKPESTSARLEISEVDGIPAEHSADTLEEEDGGETGAEEVEDNERKKLLQRILAKFEKIKYTFSKIYDKIKHIIENISFYKELFQDAETQELLQHGMFRLGRILKSIRPRRLAGNILFGTGSPDTTGYAFGIYCMAAAWLGNNICVTPDFTQAIFEGDIYAQGRITVFQVLWHSVRVLLDKRLKLLIHRIKTHKI